MKFKRLGFLLLTALLGFACAFVLVGFADVSSALAEGQTGISSVQRRPPPPDDSELIFIAFFTDDWDVSITDLVGNVLGEGIHGGEVRCNRVGSCNQKTQFLFTIPLANSEYEYKFDTRQAINIDERRAIVSGRGILSVDGQKERFLFTATFQDNRDGTITVRYEASRPEASFIIPNAPGRMMFTLPGG